jgi:class 3 adenylate cyclase
VRTGSQSLARTRSSSSPRLGEDIQRFVTSVCGEAEPETVLSTVLFTDIVDSTQRAAEVGDRQWAELVASHHALVRRQLDRFRGRELDTAGDGFFASFDGPARGIRCARAISESVRELGLEVRAGLHTGECEVIGDKLGGIAVNIGARVAARAQPGEVLVSSTVKDLVAGSGIGFEDRGTAELKGVPGAWQLFAVE